MTAEPLVQAPHRQGAEVFQLPDGTPTWAAYRPRMRTSIQTVRPRRWPRQNTERNMRPVFLLIGFLSTLPSSYAQVMVGADLSFLPRLEHSGAMYRDYGHVMDPLDIFRAHDYRVVRLRLWHTPQEPWHGLDYTLAFARRVSRAGFDLLLDLHYSDTWADPSQQTKPSAWSDLDFAVLRDSVYAYTNAVIRRFRDGGALPRYVQTGNEISNGFLWNDGRVDGAWDTPQQWWQLTTLLNAAIAAVRDSLPGEQQPTIIIHVAEGGDNVQCRRMFDHLRDANVPFDVIGLSYYPWWHGHLSALRSNLNDLATRYGKQIQVVEIAYPWTLAGCDSTDNIVGLPSQLLLDYGATATGQQSFLRDVLALVRDVPNGLGTGLVYWEPAWISTPIFGSAWENVALFDFTGGALPALDLVLENVTTNGQQTPVITICESYPNPFNATTVITYDLPRRGRVSLCIFDLLGREVAVLKDGLVEAGTHLVMFDGSNLASGVYFARLDAGKFSQTRKLMLLK